MKFNKTIDDTCLQKELIYLDIEVVAACDVVIKVISISVLL